MTRTEKATMAFWFAAKRLRDPDARLAPADRATLQDTLGMIATTAPARIAQAAARRLEREATPYSDGGDVA